MPKYEVTVTESRDLIYEVDAVNSEDGKAAVTLPGAKLLTPDVAFTQTVKDITRKLEPQELVYKMQIENIRRDYDSVASGKLPSGESIDEGTMATMKTHLATLHDTLVKQSGMDIPPLGEGGSIIAEHIGDSDPAPLGIDEDPEAIWHKAATKLGWHYDEDYKGWIKPENKTPGKIHGEWDAYVRDLTAEDACNEEGIDTVEEAKGVILGRPMLGAEH
jgi:hypothetical protein